MGSGGPTTVSTSAFDDLERRILERLGELAKRASQIMFACEAIDLPALTARLQAAGLLDHPKTLLVAGPISSELAADVADIQLLVTFSDVATDTKFLDSLIELAVTAKKQGIHARAVAASTVPSKIRAYRWRAMDWDELLNLLR